MVSGQFLGATALVVLMGSLMLPQAVSGQGVATANDAILPAPGRPPLMIAQANGRFVIAHRSFSPPLAPSLPIPLGQAVRLDRRLVDALPQPRSIRHAPSEITHEPR